MASNEGSDLGPWEGADLAGTEQQNAGVGSDSGLPAEVRFLGNVAKLARRRIGVSRANDPNRPGVFLLSPGPPSDHVGEARRVPMLDNGLTHVTGRIWFVGPGPSSGHYLDHNYTDDDELFRYVTDTIGLGTIPTIIIDPRPEAPALRYYPCGLISLNEVTILSLDHVQVAFDDVRSIAEKLYRDILVSPDNQPKAGKLWKKPDQHWPMSRAEEIIQLYLVPLLLGAYPALEVRHEETSAEGRLDICIYERDVHDRSITKCHGLIELKVIRSFGETGKPYTDQANKDWIESGVKQASAYGDRRSAAWRALFCYDMRSTVGLSCFDHVASLAGKLNVLLARWYLFASSSEFREHLAQAKLAPK